MVLLTTTPQILSAISLLPSDSPLRSSSNPTTSNNEEPPPLPTTLDSPISHETLISLSRALLSTQKPQQDDRYTLNTLLRNTRPYQPPPSSPLQPSPSYLALKRQLLLAQEQREYNLLLKPQNPNPNTSLLFPSSSDPDEPPDDISVNLILNILLSILLCAFAVFYASQHLNLTPRYQTGVRVLLALGAGIVVGVAEVGVYAAYLRKMGEARGREGKRKERKVVVGREVVGDGGVGKGRGNGSGQDGKGGGEGDDEVEKTEIWGKGVNGGVRRRVRERWDKERERGGELESEEKMWTEE